MSSRFQLPPWATRWIARSRNWRRNAMCDFSGRLVAWMDRELPDNEAGDAERHVRDWSECRKRVDAYKQVSRAFVAHCDAVMDGTTRRRPRWVHVLASATAAAAVLFLVFQPASVKQIPVLPP